MTTKVKPEVRGAQITSIRLIPTPPSCPFDNNVIEITYIDGQKQCMSQQTGNPNGYGTHEFETTAELVDYYNNLRKEVGE